MGIRFFHHWKWVLPVRTPPLSTSSTRPQQSSSSSLRSREASFDSARVSTLSVIPEEVELCHKDSLRPHVCSFGTLETLERNDSSKRVVKMSIDKTGSVEKGSSVHLASQQENNTYLYTLLMENLARVEQAIGNPDLLRLERDILTQIDRLGALCIFHACLSRSIQISKDLFTSGSLAGESKASPICSRSGINTEKGIVRSVKRMERKSKRKRALLRASKRPISYSSTGTANNTKWALSKLSSTRSRRFSIARTESEMSEGVKDVANLERIRISLEERIEMVSFKRWADAVGISERELRQRLYSGWDCRDKLLKSSRSLVVYLARNYRGQGISAEDLVQAGNIGVLQGAERFDPTKGYQFSTYVQYWIRRSISTFVAKHSRGIKMPQLFNNVMITTKKAQKVLYNLHKRHSQDEELAKFTGISIANVRLACKHLRAVGSIEQKIGDATGAKFMEITPDASVNTPEEIVMRQHMRKEIYELLAGLRPREKQVLMLRYGIGDGRCKSLGEIGSLFGVSKEWIRKIERSALIRLRQEDIQSRLKHYIEL
ncbi:hypothetical protein H6P81_001045 [Aristolochia fimbriata]|uniref:Sigma factor n=1 Tax=Aristolochia fimbriata TaxID=158543 RepID=A0AAV7F934_ARIFI|nr:hypothetical protein H6P81_001045 [Aristolochia fimbriata]